MVKDRRVHREVSFIDTDLRSIDLEVWMKQRYGPEK